MSSFLFDVVVVGAGFAGAVCAERFAAAGRRVLVIEKRHHVGGNAYDHFDAHGVLVHAYGPHIFHTNSKYVFAYLSRFTEWRFYEHRVLAFVDGMLVPLPINRTTINRLYGLRLDEAGIEAFLQGIRENREAITTSEDVVLASVGRDLCDKFFRHYTRKQWGLDLSELSPGVAARIPTRTNDDDRYFTDAYQFMPASGYTALFQRLLDHPLISVALDTDFLAERNVARGAHVVFTGPIDAFYGFRYGPLPYRSLHFEHQHIASTPVAQAAATINYPQSEAFTRITEMKHLTGQQHTGTSLVREFPRAEGDPYYPIPRPANAELYSRYARLASSDPSVTFVGRLAEYRYYNMDQVVAAALSAAQRLITSGVV